MSAETEHDEGRDVGAQVNELGGRRSLKEGVAQERHQHKNEERSRARSDQAVVAPNGESQCDGDNIMASPSSPSQLVGFAHRGSQ